MLWGGKVLPLDHLAVLDTCGAFGAGGVALNFEQSNSSDSAVDTGQTFWVSGHDSPAGVSHVPGGRYRLCWCSSFNQCSIASDFNVNIGSLTLVGPSPLTQSWTCISGTLCETSFVHGQDLSSNDSIVMLDDCSSGTYSAGLLSEPGNMKITLISSETLSIQFDVPITAAAGTYRLCWCQPLNRDISDACDFATEHSVDLGQMTLLGPTLSQQRTCIAGQQCTIEGLSLGESWTPQHTVIVLDTCSEISFVKGWPTGAIFSVQSSGASLSFGSAVVTAPGGTYELCWCGKDCGYKNAIRIGEISLIGAKSSVATSHMLQWSTLRSEKLRRISLGCFEDDRCFSLPLHAGCNQWSI